MKGKLDKIFGLFGFRKGYEFEARGGSNIDQLRGDKFFAQLSQVDLQRTDLPGVVVAQCLVFGARRQEKDLVAGQAIAWPDGHAVEALHRVGQVGGGGAVRPAESIDQLQALRLDGDIGGAQVLHGEDQDQQVAALGGAGPADNAGARQLVDAQGELVVGGSWRLGGRAERFEQARVARRGVQAAPGGGGAFGSAADRRGVEAGERLAELDAVQVQFVGDGGVDLFVAQGAQVGFAPAAHHVEDHLGVGVAGGELRADRGPNAEAVAGRDTLPVQAVTQFGGAVAGVDRFALRQLRGQRVRRSGEAGAEREQEYKRTPVKRGSDAHGSIVKQIDGYRAF